MQAPPASGPTRRTTDVTFPRTALSTATLALTVSVLVPATARGQTFPATEHPANTVGPVNAPSTGDPSASSPTSNLLAGYHNDLFFIGTRAGNFFIAPEGRLQLDAVGFTGGVTNDYTAGPGMTYHRGDVKDGFIFRRARIELVGGFFDRFTWMIGADYDLSSAPVATDIFINAMVHPLLNIQLGQFDAPFTMENRTSDKYLDFVERSMAVRALGIPSNKEFGAMAWGEFLNRIAYYSIGVFDGDGQNRTNRDNNFDVIGRAFAHPFITTGGVLQYLQLGGSLRWGVRGASVDYTYYPMTTPGGYTYFNPVLSGGSNPVNVVPDGPQLDLAAEFDLPIQRFDLRGEFVYVRNDTREMGAALSGANPLRLGDLTGTSFYAQVGYWIWGAINVNGLPGYENPPSPNLNHPDPSSPPQGVELLARFEDLQFTYSGGSRGGGSAPSQPWDGTYTVLAVDVGANYWATRHLRFSLDYMEYIFPGQSSNAVTPAADANRAQGPHGSPGSFGEFLSRVAIAL